MTSILNAIFLFFVIIYPILFLVWFSFLHHPNFVLFLAASSSVLNLACLLSLAAFELRAVTGKVGLVPLLYPIGGVTFILAILTTTIKVMFQKEIVWKDQG
jgi:hypothetical protein